MRARSLLLLAGILAVLPTDHGAAVPAAEVLRYTIKHAVYGDIGIYSNIVERNPWSASVLGSDTMMRVDTGAVEPVRIGGGETTVAVDGARPANTRSAAGPATRSG